MQAVKLARDPICGTFVAPARAVALDAASEPALLGQGVAAVMTGNEAAAVASLTTCRTRCG